MPSVVSSLLWLLPAVTPPVEPAEPATLLFDVPTECASMSEFRHILAQEHQIELAELSGVELLLETGEEGYVLSWRDPSTERKFVEEDCRTLFRTAVVIAASFIHPEGATEAGADSPKQEGALLMVGQPERPAEVEPSDQGEISSESEAAPQDAEPMAPALKQDQASEEDALPNDEGTSEGERAPDSPPPAASLWPLQTELSVGAGIRLGLSPSVGILLEGEGALLFGPLGLAVALAYAPPTTHFLEEEVGIRLESWLLQVGAAFRPLERLRIDLGFCAVRVVGESSNVSNPARDGVWMWAPRLDTAVVVAQHRVVDLEVVGSLWVGANTPRFEISRVGEIYRLPRLGGALYFRGNFANR